MVSTQVKQGERARHQARCDGEVVQKFLYVADDPTLKNAGLLGAITGKAIGGRMQFRCLKCGQARVEDENWTGRG